MAIDEDMAHLILGALSVADDHSLTGIEGNIGMIRESEAERKLMRLLQCQQPGVMEKYRKYWPVRNILDSTKEDKDVQTDSRSV